MTADTARYDKRAATFHDDYVSLSRESDTTEL